MNGHQQWAAQRKGRTVQQRVLEILEAEADQGRCAFAQVNAATVGRPGAMSFKRGGNGVDFVGWADLCGNVQPVAFDVKTWNARLFAHDRLPPNMQAKLPRQLAWLERFYRPGHTLAGLMLVTDDALLWLDITKLRGPYRLELWPARQRVPGEYLVPALPQPSVLDMARGATMPVLSLLRNVATF